MKDEDGSENRISVRDASDERADRPVVVGIAGGSASGKTAVARKVVGTLGAERTALVPHDAYYRDLSHLPLEERRRVNVDHPDSLETALLVEHLDLLLAGQPVEIPCYDYSSHVRLPERRRVEPAPVVVVEGILVLADEELRRRMDLSVFVDVPEEERLARRLRRDVEERGRTPESVREDHEWRVQPMHREFVGPSRAWADIVVEQGGRNQEAILRIARRVEALLQGS
ncbi:MAG: uridine kinase [Longimicrobiales bacterium]|nr:uridine kinase [Longimicrobiales bacterium]